MMKNYSFVKRTLLRELSENSRVSFTTLAKRLKCSRNTVVSNIDSLKKELGLHYTVEFDKTSLGITHRHIWAVKFGTSPPTQSELKEIFKDDPYSLLVARTQGDFDLLIHVAADSGWRYTNWRLTTAMKLLKYKPTIKPSMIIMRHTGFTLLNNSLLEKIDMSRHNLDELDKKILMLLNENSRLSLAAMAKSLKEDVETIRYRLRKLSKSKIIRRFTIVLEKPPKNYQLAFFMNLELAPGIMKRYRSAYEYYVENDKTEGMPIVNNFQYLALLSGSYIFFGLACFENDEEAFKYAINEHRKLYMEDSPIMEYAKITSVVKGIMPVRNVQLEKDFKQINLDSK